jgi:hypothetical protein
LIPSSTVRGNSTEFPHGSNGESVFETVRKRCILFSPEKTATKLAETSTVRREGSQSCLKSHIVIHEEAFSSTGKSTHTSLSSLWAGVVRCAQRLPPSMLFHVSLLLCSATMMYLLPIDTARTVWQHDDNIEWTALRYGRSLALASRGGRDECY